MFNDRNTPQRSVLYNVDIAHHIVWIVARKVGSDLFPTYLAKGTMQTLARCACICKSFSEPALALLWRCLRSPIPLLSVLSGFQLADPDCGGQDAPAKTKYWIINSGLSVVDRERFAYYARFVWAFDVRGDRIHPSVFTILEAACGDQLLPHLRFVRCFSTASAYVLHPFLTPSLLSLHWEDDADRDAEKIDAAERLASEILTLAPTLEKLHVPRCNTTSLLSSFGTFEQLRSLDISSTPRVPNWTMIRAIASLEHLTEVYLPSAVVGCQPADRCLGFQTLTSLTISHRREGTDLLRLISPPGLQHLKLVGGLSLLDCWSSEEIREGVELCLSKCVATFTSIVIDDFELGAVDSIVATAEPFFRMRNLRTFRCCRGMMALTVQDDDLRAMGAAWPHLEELQLKWSSAESLDDPSAIPSLQGIVELAHACLHLVRVDLSYARLSLAPDAEPYPGPVHGLEDLILGRGQVREPVRLARIIDRLFPHSKLSIKNLIPRERVSDLLREFETVRRDRLAPCESPVPVASTTRDHVTTQ
ncbi:uncharacterized protein C8Q71DRAFT_427706 [Rhodofomes roseus]|uniref:F-box domain-containing protein n=1 Tax=Rhodofomes roseus TaxID=34475 RepID=A0ABQ8KQR9_9APHY|nr:uncharacterized protein C8Q71DRAFT_427706 [Rhodofomes roseus]KAH9840875.1 hypothetical protein C8Q71DRAFT_427706 [Rhodofomes roseus]